jgi:hypothetical protein
MKAQEDAAKKAVLEERHTRTQQEVRNFKAAVQKFAVKPPTKPSSTV